MLRWMGALALLGALGGCAVRHTDSRAFHGDAAANSRTQIVRLGIGTPVADPERSGPCVAIVVDGEPRLVSFSG